MKIWRIRIPEYKGFRYRPVEVTGTEDYEFAENVQLLPEIYDTLIEAMYQCTILNKDEKRKLSIENDYPEYFI